MEEHVESPSGVIMQAPDSTVWDWKPCRAAEVTVMKAPSLVPGELPSSALHCLEKYSRCRRRLAVNLLRRSDLRRFSTVSTIDGKSYQVSEVRTGEAGCSAAE